MVSLNIKNKSILGQFGQRGWVKDGERGKEVGKGGTMGEKKQQDGEGFGVRKQDLNPARAVTAAVVWCCEESWTFSCQH